ncbi:MAG TPA: GNAT family N-acetyltransferase [Candidatus Methanoculleus thermohydrogenotrophicum]|jgi:nucleotide-binding universal stress UspA family protein/GNAT superfamily N-acetyltransferase|nr:GNAT family N-acetyltransferase [Candidatus Methanoculleus thermohydrogenotrophicum]HOB17482.1 GNAT family N-acetyltransferase [Candidatus Methanoculleus thermohydrogenotrophicum]HPZ37637.1 GNAT family N-acetyltransferase [Candidatus Methanoculleus thermohydrogenotrophicum]HQE09644.1 GNAT family N-acetyltransferase [Bacillota bacterium]HQE09688.1 GNAT family N-acetyltransferase [Bacillota bacterium]
MFTKVLIPTDLSLASAVAAERIGEVPGVREVVLFHARVSAGPLPTDEPLRRMEDLVRRQGIPVEVVVAEYDRTPVPERILAAASGTGADLIVMGVRDQGLLRNLFSGNVAATVLRDARIHVLIVPRSGGGGGPLFARLLVPTDLAALAPEVRSILEEPAVSGTAVLLHVVEPAQAGKEQEAVDRLAALQSSLSPVGREIRGLVRTGTPARTICAVADEISASAVIIPRIGKRDAPGSAPLGSVTAGVVGCIKPPALVLAVPIHLRIVARELRREEFALAEELWIDYHQLKADPETDRIFGVFADDTLVSVARCRRHPDGYEVDGVFTPVRFRGRGYARRAMDALVEACQHDTLYMHSVRNLVDFYGRTYGFVAIPESDLPPSIRERFAFALGDMEGANVQPMRRDAGRFRR